MFRKESTPTRGFARLLLRARLCLACLRRLLCLVYDQASRDTGALPFGGITCRVGHVPAMVGSEAVSGLLVLLPTADAAPSARYIVPVTPPSRVE